MVDRKDIEKQDSDARASSLQEPLIEAAANQQALDRLRLLAEQLQRQILVLTKARNASTLETSAESAAQPSEPEQPELIEQADPRAAQWERQMAAKVEAMSEIQSRLDQVRNRQEQQVGAYLAEIERLREQVSELSVRVGNFGRRAGTQARRHHRFAGHTTNMFVAGLLSPAHSPEFLQGAIMDAPIITRTNYQPVFKLNPEGEYQLMDFLVLHDRNFVQAAYQAILRREPDPDGAAHYLAQVRSGESKAKILDQLLHSEEGRQKHTTIHGLASHLKLTRLCELPFVGRPIEAMLFLANVRGHLRDLRVLENHVIRIAEEAQALHEANMIKLRSLSR